MSPESPCRARFIFASGTVSSVFSVPKIESLRLADLVVALDELRALDEHAARATGRVEHATVEGLEDLDDEPDDGVRREELAAALALLRGEVGEEVLVDQAERIAVELRRAAVRRAAAARSGLSARGAGSRAAGCP